jgi:predicted permease
MHAHLRLLEDDFIARGMDAPDAGSAARRAFGGRIQQITEEHRDERSFPWMPRIWLDLKLGLRMLARYPGLTAVAVLGMAVGIAICAAAFVIGHRLLDPSMPLDESDRIVAIQNWDIRTNDREPRALHDFLIWRDELTSVEDLGAFRSVPRNLIAPGSQPEAVVVAEISASAFRVARVAPLLGRPLVPDDERIGAPDVIMIGYEVWQRRFAGDPGIVGRQVQLGDVPHTVVGVMPPGFRFPVNDSYWLPLPVAASYEPLEGPAVTVFGRIAPGAALEGAQAEIAAMARQMANVSPGTHQYLRPRLVPYAHAFTDMDDPESAMTLRVVQSAVLMLLVVVCVNVAILVYARAATRQGEIAIRTALGASRQRIVAQLFVEAAVLAAAAAALGIALVGVGLDLLENALTQLGTSRPFWLTFELSAEAVSVVVALTMLAAGIIGIVPALKATGARVQSGLQGIPAGGGSRMQMGRLWTGLIVCQVAVAVALLTGSVLLAWDAVQSGLAGPGFAAHEFLRGTLVLDRSGSPDAAPASERQPQLVYRHRLTEIEERLESEPAVAGVSFSMTDPGGELAAVLEAEGVAAPAEPVDYNIVEGTKQGHLVRFNKVAPDYFDLFAVPVLAGRTFQAADAAAAARAVVVNRTFAERILPGGHVIERRVRYVGRSREAGPGNVEIGRWYDVVGVVADFPPPAAAGSDAVAAIYHAVTPGDLVPVVATVRVRGGDASAFAPRLREIAAAVDPRLQLRGLASADERARSEQGMFRLIGATLVSVILSVVVLAAAGIYALVAFTVARRRKEIGIRAALGADARRILRGVFSRVFAQLAGGAVVGMICAFVADSVSGGELLQDRAAVVLPLVALAMTAVGVLAALGPARRGLRIQPIEALRQE